MTDTDLITNAHRALTDDDRLLTRLAELRGWTPDAIRRLGLGLYGDRVLIPVLHADGTVASLLRYQPDPDRRGDQPKMLAAPGGRRELFPPPETINAPTVWIVEGEADAIAATSAGLPATSVPGAGGWNTRWAERFTDLDVVVCCDCDPPGRGLAARIADDLLDHATTIRIVDLAAARDDGYDLSDLILEADGDYASIRAMLDRIAANTPAHLPEADRPPRPSLTVADWQRALLDHLDGRSTATAAWPIPFARLRDATDGGIRPGELWVIAGYTSHGKSIYADMLLDSVADAGARCHLYMTEMTVVQRGLRLIARRTGLSLSKLRLGRLNDQQRQLARDAVARLPYAASVVNDWTPRQVVADIRASGTQLAVIDLLHGFHYRDERELSEIVELFATSASSDTAIVLVCHLNDIQMSGARSPQRPKPGMHSLKGATSIKQRADAVIFAWLEDDDDGLPGPDGIGEVWIAKNRNGGLDSQPVQLNPVSVVLEPAGGVLIPGGLT